MISSIPTGQALTAGSQLGQQAVDFAIHVLGAVAEKKAKTISTRIKDALAAKKARGFQLGTPADLTAEARAKGQQQRQLNAQSSLANP